VKFTPGWEPLLYMIETVFFFFFTKRNDLFIFSSVNNGDRSIVLTMRREGESVWNENGKFSRLFGFKIDHPYDDDLRVDLTVYR